MLDGSIGLNREKVGRLAAIISFSDHTVIDLVRDRFEAVFRLLRLSSVGGFERQLHIGGENEEPKTSDARLEI